MMFWISEKNCFMSFAFLEAPCEIASKESQVNEFVIDTAIKSCSSQLTVFVFGEFYFVICYYCSVIHIQKYISSLYTTIWDYCLFYKKIQLNPNVIPIFKNGIHMFPSNHQLDFSPYLIVR